MNSDFIIEIWMEHSSILNKSKEDWWGPLNEIFLVFSLLLNFGVLNAIMSIVSNIAMQIVSMSSPEIGPHWNAIHTLMQRRQS